MAFFGFRAYPTPILKPLWPFFASSAIVYYCVSKMQYAGVRSETYAKDPKNLSLIHISEPTRPY